MIMTTHRTIVLRILAAFFGLSLAVSVLFMSGCGIFSSAKRETKLLYKGTGGSSGAYQKIMVILPFENNAPWVTIDLNTNFAREIKKAIEDDCSEVRVLLPGSPDFPTRFNEPVYMSDGELDSAAMAASGQASGINMVLAGRLAGIRHVTDNRGMLWFKKVAHLARIQMDITIYHTGTGARLFDRSVFHDIEITETEGERVDVEEMPNALPLDIALTELSETLGKSVCGVLKYIPWEGYVGSVEGDRIILSAGASCGLKKGRELTVYNVDKMISDQTAQSFFSTGNEAGRITITSVYPDRSEAVLKDGGPILPGSVVRKK